MKRLASAILIQAVKDWEKQKYQPEIREFLASAWFDFLIEAAGLDAEKSASVRRQILSGSYQRVNMRAAYR